MVGIRRKQTAVAKICAIDSLPGEELASRWSSRGSRLGRPVVEAQLSGAPDRARQDRRHGHRGVRGHLRRASQEILLLFGAAGPCKELLRLKIRRGSEAKQRARAHDILEDVLAAREIVLRCLRHPSDLDALALKAKKETKA
ncbi:hypothetical protein DL762_001831 [Monosporascus cannonballus]|uniref:Uncharacterized protein n=1 Tax=Monosporascus cannonballus TaxID=155416 RepID=A0ABY0HJD6_9PEZI|nr:hypothetical protein DL762_001831 [Monosporascus cannonballus]